MGLLDLFRRKALSANPNVLEAWNAGLNPYPPLGGTNLSPRVNAAWERGVNATYGWMYATQPAVRSVIDYIATNTAQLTLRVFKIVNDDERERKPDHPAALTMRYPRDGVSSESFVRRLVTDKLIFDNAYFVKFPGMSNNQRVLQRIQPDTVSVKGGRFTVESYWLWREDGTWYGPVPPEAMFHWYGYDPEDPLLGRSKLETLRQELAADSALQAALVEVAKGGMKSGHIERPLEAEWSNDDMKRFLELYKATKKDPEGTPVLDEGMTYVQDSISAKDADVIASRQFTRSEVAREFGMETFPPQSEDERRQFYSDVLAPLIISLAGELNVSLLQQEYKATDHFFEFDLNEKAYQDPWKLWQIFTASAGGPWQTRDEVRALVGLPPFGGPADELIVPANVIEEDPNSPSLPAPNVMPIQDPNKPPVDGSYREAASLPPGGEATLLEILDRHYKRQESKVRSAKSTEALADERWPRELAEDIRAVFDGSVDAEGVAHEVHSATLQAMNGTPPEQVFKRLREDAIRWASDIDRARVMVVAASLLDDASEGG